jgi:hypothetical protein
MAYSGFVPYGGGNAAGTDNTNLPEWMKIAIGNVGNIGPGAASSVATSGPQDFSALQKIYDASLGRAQSQLDPASIRNLFGDSISAAMKLGGEQINSAEGERGAAVRPGGVAEQKMMDLGLKVQQPLVEALLGNMNAGLRFNQNSLGSLFSAASGPQSNSLGYRNTQQDINSKLPPYVRQSDPNKDSGGTGAGSASSRASGVPGGGSSTSPSGHYTGFDGYLTNDPGLGGGAGYGSAPNMNTQYNDFWNEPGYPEGPNEGFTASGSGGGSLGSIYDDADQPGGAVDKSGWLNFGSAPNAGNSVKSYVTGEGEWRPGVSGSQWWGKQY